MKTITDSGIIEKHSNNGRTQTLLIEEKNVLFRIVIHIESYDFQSYARLQVMDADRKWTILHSLSLKDYKLNKDMITEFKKFIKKVAPTIVLSTHMVEAA